MRLAEIIGQPAVTRLVARLVQRDRLPHAVVLEGVPGSGRRTVANAIAQAVLCRSPVAGDACGVCESCRLAQAGNHPDLVASPHDSEGRLMSAEEVRDEIVEAAFATPLLGDRRVFVIHAIERWNLTSANALLKVLEEPPPSVRFILTTAQSSAVLRTIRSRSQLYRLLPLGAADVAAILVRGGIPDARARERGAAAHGSHRGWWHGSPPVPLAPLLRLAREGYRSAWVAEAVAALPTRIDAALEETGVTVAAEQRRLVRAWLAATAQALREDLRLPGPEALRAIERLQRIAALSQDLARNLQPRLVIEALGLGETERLLRRVGG